MFIVRNNKKIILTPDELEAAYREQKHNYLLGDAENQFNDFLNLHFGDDESFTACFGFSGDDVCDRDSAYYLLEKFVASYEKSHDCNNAENDMWQNVIENVLKENSENVKITYDVHYVLWDVTNPELAPEIRSSNYSIRGYTSVDTMLQAEPAYLASAFGMHGIRNGKVRFIRQIEQIRNIGDDNYWQDSHTFNNSQPIDATLKDGKLVFDDADGKEG